MKHDLLKLDANAYARHPLHTADRDWAETNCYVDVWIELLHAWGFEPLAALPFTVAIDFEGDQWTFFKFPPADLDRLFGLNVQELAFWRPLDAHLEEQLSRGRPVLVELDSYFLPDTAGSAYQLAHTKSTVAVTAIDAANHRLGYFHGQGYYELTGRDFDQALRVGQPLGGEMLPPYMEFVKRTDGPIDARRQLADSLDLLRFHASRIPQENPFRAFQSRFTADLAWLAEESVEMFHQYAFATLRQLGACFELSANHLDWLERNDRQIAPDAARGYRALSTAAKSLQFQLARSMVRRRPLDLAPLSTMAATWEAASSSLQRALNVN